MPLSFKDLFKPVFNAENIDVLLHTVQHFIDRMRGFIQADELDTSASDEGAVLFGWRPSLLNSEQNKSNQIERHLANAVEALRHVLANHKKTSLFGFAWKYINLWSAIKHRLFHKNELPDYEKIIDRKAVFKSLTPFFQEMVLGLLCKLQKPDELTFIRNCTPLIRESVARNLRKCTFEQLESLKDNPLTFLEKFFKDTNTTVSDNLRDIGMRARPWDWNIFHKNKFIGLFANGPTAQFGIAGVRTLRLFLGEIQDKIFSPHLEASVIKSSIKGQALAFLRQIPNLGIKRIQASSPTNAFREIMAAEYPKCKSQVTIQKPGGSKKLVSVPNIIFSQQAVSAMKQLRDARLNGIIDRVHGELGVERAVRFASKF